MLTNSPKKKLHGVLIGGSGLIGGTIDNYFKNTTPDSITLRAPSSKKLSIRSCSDIRDYLKRHRPDFIINTAIANIGSECLLAFEVNYLGALNIARAAAALRIPYIHFSSAACLPYGEDLTEEDHLPLTSTLSNYAKSKLMAEMTLRHMHETVGLDYTSIRLSVVYGEHDHKVQGFHRLFFSIADETMPALFTKRNVLHSYTNANKLPHFIHHLLLNREEFSGQTYHFVDKEPVELANLILTIKSYLEVKTPREVYIPYPAATMGTKSMNSLFKLLAKFGIRATLPPELMFLESFYKTQTLSSQKLAQSSFKDPMPNETVYARLPALVIYYLTRWSQQNLISTFNDAMFKDSPADVGFKFEPRTLLESIHNDSINPFVDLCDLPQ